MEGLEDTEGLEGTEIGAIELSGSNEVYDTGFDGIGIVRNLEDGRFALWDFETKKVVGEWQENYQDCRV